MMNIFSILLISLFTFTSVCFSQIYWNRTFGGSEGEYGYSVQQTTDGGYIVVGSTESYSVGGYDLYVVKTDANGNKIWHRSLGGWYDDYGMFVQQTSDGGCIITGYSEQPGGYNYPDLWLVKMAPYNYVEWQKTFDGGYSDIGYCVRETADGGYIAVGSRAATYYGHDDVWLVKTDAEGNEEWDSAIDRLGDDDVGYSVQLTDDGNYIVTGSTRSTTSWIYNDIWLIKVDSDGNEIWSRTFGGDNEDCGKSVLQTNDGGFIIAGGTLSFGVELTEVILIKTDPLGHEVWTKLYVSENSEEGNFVQQTSDGGYIIAGESRSYGFRSQKALLLKTDSEGNLEWKKTFGGISYNYCESVQQTSDGGYIAAGTSSAFIGEGGSDMWLFYYRPCTTDISLAAVFTFLLFIAITSIGILICKSKLTHKHHF